MKNAMLIVVLMWSAALVQPAHAVKLEYKVKPGQTWSQKMIMRGEGTTEAAGMKFDMTIEMASTTKTTVKSVAADGSFVQVVDQKVDSTKVVVAGMTIEPPAPEQKPITITSDKLGKPLKIEGLESLANKGNVDFTKLLGAAPAQFSDKDLSVGDTWEASIAAEELPMKITGKLLSLKKVGGREVAEVEYVFRVTGETLSKLITAASGMDLEVSGPGMVGTSISQIDVATGIAGATKGTMEMDLTLKIMGQELRQAMRMNISSEPVK